MVRKPMASGVIFIAVLALLLSCGKAPPKNTKQQHFFDYTRDIFRKIDQAEYAEQVQGKAASLYIRVPYILYARKNEQIIFQQEPSVPKGDTLIYSLGDGRYRLTRSIYLTAKGKKHNLFSFDRRIWHQMSEEEPNLSFRIRAKTELQSDSVLRVYYNAELAIAPDLEPSTLKLGKRELYQGQAGDFIQLLKGRVKSHVKDYAPEKLQKELMNNREGLETSGREIDLQNVILHFPEGMEFEYSFTLTGNLIRVRTEDREVHMTFLRDIYFYYPSSFFVAVSFDGKYWGHNYFQFQIVPFGHSVFSSPNSLVYFDGLYLNHAKTEIQE